MPALMAGFAAQVVPVIVASTVLVVLGRDDPGAIAVLSFIQTVFSAGSIAVAGARHWLRRVSAPPRWADVLLLGFGTLVGAVPPLGFALTAGGFVAGGILIVAGVTHGWAAVVLDRWARGVEEGRSVQGG